MQAAAAAITTVMPSHSMQAAPCLDPWQGPLVQERPACPPRYRTRRPLSSPRRVVASVEARTLRPGPWRQQDGRLGREARDGLGLKRLGAWLLLGQGGCRCRGRDVALGHGEVEQDDQLAP